MGKYSQPWIPLEPIENALRFDMALLILALALGAWGFYKIFLKDLSFERHQNLKGLFSNLFVHIIVASVALIVFWNLQFWRESNPGIKTFNAYFGLFALIEGAMVIIKSARIMTFEYLFMGHKKRGVPILTVNLFSLVLSLLIAGWIATDIFSIKVSSLLATSAIFSVVIGLALQDTLGNLFAGAALQFDKPYEIGDWIEIWVGTQKWAGQVYEISWRATVLLGFTDELITIPNRIVGQSQVSNFATNKNPIIRSQVFKVRYKIDFQEAKRILVETSLKIQGVRKIPAPVVLMSEVTESWVCLKLVYYIDNYGEQYSVADRILEKGLSALSNMNVEIAPQRLEIFKDSDKQSL